MSLNYELLGPTQATHIRMQRLLDLEADHFRFVLDAEELHDGADMGELRNKLADIERRIKLHRQALDLPDVVVMPEESGDPAPERPDVD